MRAVLVTISACLLVATVASQSFGPTDLITCFQCTANNTNCRDTCTGMYCYKTALTMEDKELVKRGCLSRKDELSKVGECTERPSQLPGGSILKETFCICRADRCNGAATWWSSVTAIFATVVAYFWKD